MDELNYKLNEVQLEWLGELIEMAVKDGYKDGSVDVIQKELFDKALRLGYEPKTVIGIKYFTEQLALPTHHSECKYEG